MPRLYINCGWSSRKAQSWRSHAALQDAPLMEIIEILSTSSRVHASSFILRQASSIFAQNLTPASHSYPSWISTWQGDPSLSWPSPIPSTPTPQTTWPQSKSSRLEMTASQTVTSQPKRKSRKATSSNPTGHWDFPLPHHLHTRREITMVTVNFQAELQKCFQLINPEDPIEYDFSEIANCWPHEPCVRIRMLARL